MAQFTTSSDWHGIYRRTYDEGAWKSGHSNTSNNYRIYHGGTSDNAGYYNGNMMTLISMSKIKEGLNNKGVSWDRVDKVRLRIYCDWCFNHGAGAYVGIRACDSSPSGKTSTSLSGLGMTTVIDSTKVYENNWYEYSIPISTVKNYNYLAFYTPGKYNSSSYYTYFNADDGSNSSSKYMKFIVDYTDVIVPGKPTVNFRNYSGSIFYQNFNGQNGPIFRGDNNIEFYSNTASNAVKTELHIQWRDKTRDWRYAGGYPYTESGDVKRTRYYGNSDRYMYGEFNEQYFCAWTVAVSKTGHKTRSDYLYYAVNDLPSISNEVTSNTKITSNNVTINWKNWSDRLNGPNATNQWYKLWYKIYRNGNWTDYMAKSGDIRDTTSINFNLSDIGVNRGEKVRIWIEPGDLLEWSGTKYGYAEVTRNTIPYFNSGSAINTSVNNGSFNNVFSDYINVNLPTANDPDGQSISYKLYYHAPSVNGNWNYIATYNNINISSLNVGRYVGDAQELRLGVIANDGLEDSDSSPRIVSPMMKKNRKPPMITGFYIASYGHEDGDMNYESIDSLKWDNMQQFNGNKMYKYVVEMFACKRSNGESYDYKRYETYNNYLENLDFGIVRRGDIFKFKITSIDSYGYLSDACWTSDFYKNSAPSDPKNFRTVGTSHYFKNIVNLTWEPSTDIDKDVIRYELYFSKNKGQYVLLDNNIAITSYSHNISALTPGDTLGYKIIARDEYGVKSNEVYVQNNNNIFVNIPPDKPSMLYPIKNKQHYINKPRIIINITDKHNKPSLTAYVTLNGTTYVSSTAANCFNKQFYASGDYIVFIPSVDLNDGVNNISIKLSDGLDESQSFESTITYASPVISRLGSNSFVPVSVDVYIKMRDMVNKNREAYGKTANSTLTPIKNETKVFARYFSDLYYNSLEANKMLNEQYSGLNRNHPLFPSITGPVSKEMYNIIYDLITNL